MIGPNEQRSRIMRAVRSRDTRPELALRKLLREMGHSGYRLHRNDLPGKPDIAFVGRKRVISLHGCFWHGHDCARGARLPATNSEYWRQKIERNRQRDRHQKRDLAKLGWRVLTVWECQLKEPEKLKRRIMAFMQD